MNGLLRDPPRWTDAGEQGDRAERAAGDAARSARALLSRPAPPLARVTARMRPARAAGRRAWILAAAAFVLGVATAASAAHLDLLPTWLERMVSPKRAVPEHAGGQRAKSRAAAPAARPGSTAAAPEPAAPPSLPADIAPASVPVASDGPASAEVVRPRMAPAPRKVGLLEGGEHAPRPTSSAARPPSPPVALGPAPAAPETAGTAPAMPAVWPEVPAAASVPGQPAAAPPGSARSASAHVSPVEGPSPAGAAPGATAFLTEAIRLLRAERAPKAALRFLDDHKRELDHGGFGHESLILRVEALLALGRPAEVLRLLDGAALTDVAAAQALLVTRGELRATAGRCGEGIGDFALVLARSRPTDRRALVGRALCRQQLGDAAGARADVERLRKEFPNQPLPAELVP
jgi:hypothetical protein